MKHSLTLGVVTLICIGFIAICAVREERDNSMVVLTAPGNDPGVFVKHVLPPLFAPDKPTVSVDQTFTITNPRTYPVAITGYELSACKCVDLKYDVQTLAAGQSTPLTLQLQPFGLRKYQTYRVHLLTDDPLSPKWTYYVVADWYPKVMAEPQQVFLGEPRERPNQTVAIRCYAKSKSELASIADVHAGPSLCVENLTAPVDVTLENGVVRRSWAMVVGFRSAAVNHGNPREVIVVQFDNAANLTIPITWSDSNNFSVRPSRLFLSPNSERRRCVVTIQALEGTPFQITGVRASPDAIRHAEFDHGKVESVHELTFSNDDSLTESCSGTITITVAHFDESETITVPFTVMVGPSSSRF